MVWPSNPRNLEDFPMEASTREWIDTVDNHTAAHLCQFVLSHHGQLEAITGGDEAKERALGNLLIGAAIMSANVRERALLGMPVL